MVVSGGGQEELPVFDLVLVFDELGERHDRWADRLLEEFESGFPGSFVGLAGVDVAIGEDAVFPGRFAAAGAGEDVVDVGLGEGEFTAGVLASAAIALPKSAQSEAQTLAGKAVEGAEDHHGGNADFSAHGADGGVAFADGKLAPGVPGKRGHAIGSLDIEAQRLAVDHGTEDVDRGGGHDRQPVPVENEDGGEMERVGHRENEEGEVKGAGHKKAPRRRIEAGRLNGWIPKVCGIYSLLVGGSHEAFVGFPIPIPSNVRHMEWLRVERRSSFMGRFKFGAEADGAPGICQRHLPRNDVSTDRDG